MMLDAEISLFAFSPSHPLIVSHDDVLTYGDFSEEVARLGALNLDGVVALVAQNTISRIASYLACLTLRLPVLLLEGSVSSEYLNELINRFGISHLIGARESEFTQFDSIVSAFGDSWATNSSAPRVSVSPQLAVLLATSGSTGNPKYVRLSRKAVLHNARAIAQGLHISPDDRAVTSLPFSYTYGLSVINSHFVSGATICVTDETIVSPDFWRLVAEQHVTTIAGVPTSYKMLRKMRWSPAKYEHLRYLTQAGGRLDDADRQYFLDLLGEQNIDFYVMYGQTEATARITITPPEDLHAHIGTAGRPLEDGWISIEEPDENGIGSVVYHGPNVMMGYAESDEDLAREDDMNGDLETGDLGFMKDGLLFLTGRTKRIVKIFGIRVSLDDVDRWLHQFGNAVAIQGNDSVTIFIENPAEAPDVIRQKLSEHLRIHPSGVKVVVVEALPLLSSGKVDFQTLAKMATDS
jgi:acyl-CoA synthetase (AMP-forming)/AMP-acid ligase II